MPILAFGAACLVSFLRAPNLLVDPRFWAEEGTVYVQYAWEHPWYQALVAPHQGYLGLVHNALALLAAHVPPRWAPWPTTFGALCLQLLPLGLILTGRSELWSSPLRRLVGCALVLLNPASTGEVWLNAASAHFHLALVAFLVLLEPAGVSRIRVWVARALLGLAGLSSPPALFLTPVFVWAASREKGERRRQAVILCGCAVIQALVAIATAGSSRPDLPATAVVALGKALVRHAFVSPYLGFWISGNWAGWAAAAFALLSAGVLGRHGISDPGGRRLLGKAIAGFALTLGLSVVLSVRMTGASRYAYAPAVMLALAYLIVAISGAPHGRLGARACLAVMVVAGAILFRPNMAPFNRPTEWPSWRAEVERVAAGGPGPLRIWPQSGRGYAQAGWSVRLPPRLAMP